MRLNTILIIALMGIQSVLGQDSLLTREAAIELALENNFGIAIAKNQVAIAENNKSILNTGFLPGITASGGANYNRDDSVIEFPGQFLENGDPRPDAVLDQAESQRYNGGLTVNYTLFDGLGRLYNYRRLKEQYDLSELQARETIENTILQMFSVYWEVARLTENEFLLASALNVSQDRIRRAEYAFDYGQNTKLDVLNARVDATNDSINLLNARQELQNAKRDLNVVLNRDLGSAVAVDTVIRFIPRLQLEAFLEDVNEKNVVLLQTEKNEKINAYDIMISRSGYLPTVGLNGTYGWNLNQSAQSAFFPGVNNETWNFGLGASLTWNIFDGGNTAVRVKNAKIAYENQELLNKQITLEVKRDLENAHTIYENRLAIYEIQEQNVITNQNNFERSKEEYQLGRISSIEFRQAQVNLLNAQTSKNLAKYNAKLAELQLLQLTGHLLNIPL